MDWVFEHLQIIIAIAAGVAYWLNNLRQSREEARREAENPTNPEDFFGPDFDLEDILNRQQPPAIPQVRQVTPPPLPTANESELARQQQIQERLRQARANRASSINPIATSGLGKKSAASSSRIGGLRAQLKDRKEIRSAFILREILGPPAGLS